MVLVLFAALIFSYTQSVFFCLDVFFWTRYTGLAEREFVQGVFLYTCMYIMRTKISIDTVEREKRERM